MGKGGLFNVYTFLLSFFSGVGVGRSKVRRHQGFVCYFVLVLMQLVSTKDRIDSYFSQLGFVKSNSVFRFSLTPPFIYIPTGIKTGIVFSVFQPGWADSAGHTWTSKVILNSYLVTKNSSKNGWKLRGSKCVTNDTITWREQSSKFK